VRISARKGLVVVRSGKGDAYREVEHNALVRAMLDEWVAERAKIAQEGQTSFFVSRTGSALSSRSGRPKSYRAREAPAIGPRPASHIRDRARARRQRPRARRRARRAPRLEATRRYSLPSKADRQKAVSDSEIDF
jgi:hypothetical protein